MINLYAWSLMFTFQANLFNLFTLFWCMIPFIAPTLVILNLSAE